MLVAMHVPPIMYILIATGDTPTRPTPAVQKSTTPPIQIPSTPIQQQTNQNPNSFQADASCPDGIISALLKNNLTPSRKVICKQTDFFLYKDQEAKIYSVLYSFTVPHSEADDVARPITVPVTVLPTGDISFETNYLNLRNNVSSSVKNYVLNKFSAIPFKGNVATLVGEITGPDSNNEYCGTFMLSFPFMGTIIACTDGNDVTSTSGTAQLDSTAPDFDSMKEAVFEYASSTFPLAQYQAIYGMSPIPPYTLESLYYDPAKYWVLEVQSGFINSDRFIKVDANKQISCIRSYGGLSDGCP